MDIQPTVLDMQTMCEEFMHRSIYAKTQMCKEEAMQDNPSVMMIGFVSTEESDEAFDEAMEFQHENDTSKPYKVAVLPLIHRDDIYECIADIVKHLPAKEFSFIAIIAEGYTSPNSPADIASASGQMHGGALETDFQENPFSEVRETLIVTAVDWECRNLYTVMAPYKYDDFGVPVFDEGDSTMIELLGFENYGAKELEEMEIGKLPSTLVSFVMFTRFATVARGYTSKLRDAPKRKKEKNGE
jgi:hypothetical protein